MRESVKSKAIGVVCRTIGCSSVFARWFEWPHRVVCMNVDRESYG